MQNDAAAQYAKTNSNRTATEYFLQNRTESAHRHGIPVLRTTPMGDARSGTRNTADLGSDRPEGVKSESNPLIKSQQAKKGTSCIDKIVII